MRIIVSLRFPFSLVVAATVFANVNAVAAAAKDTVESCELNRVKVEAIFEKTQVAKVSFSWNGEALTMTLHGSHQDHDVIDRAKERSRVYLLTPHLEIAHLAAWVFSDSQTAGIISQNYSGATRMTLHVQGFDNVYLEHFHGHCGGLG